MTKFDLQINKGNYIYLKEEIREVFPSEKVIAIANAATITIFPPETDLKDVESSVEIVLEDIRLRRKMEEEAEVVDAE